MSSTPGRSSARDASDAAELVGHLELRVELAAPSTDAAKRWEQRAAALATWLLSEWRREREEAA